jgi:two-component system, response regulator
MQHRQHVAHVPAVTILLADDDPDDRMLARLALTENHLVNELREVVDGEDLLDYLRHHGRYSDPALSPRPSLILLDLNMPRKNGSEALAEIKHDPSLRCIPVVILTTSQVERDIFGTYDVGANSFISKTVTFDGLVEVMQALGRYWFQIVEQPGSPPLR